MLRRQFCLLLFIFSLLLSANSFATEELKERLLQLSNVSSIEKLESDFYTEKYVTYIVQPIDHKDISVGEFSQRVIVCHKGFDRPTVIVTEGYGGARALNPSYREEISQLFDANLIFVEHRYFLESTPENKDWKYLTAENASYDLHNVTQTFKTFYQNKWISTGISKGGQTTIQYRAYFPDDVDISVPYVAPWCRGMEDGRHELFLDKVGTKKERKAIDVFHNEVLKRRDEIKPMLERYCEDKGLAFRTSSFDELLDYVVLEYPFALWQWGRSTQAIPSPSSDTDILFDHLVRISEPEYFAKEQGYESFFVQAARELGYYGYSTKGLKNLSINNSEGYLLRLLLPDDARVTDFDPALYNKGYEFLKANDPKMICIYGEIDPWTAVRVPNFKGKKNLQIYIQPRGDHRTRINTMPEKMRRKVIGQINKWLAE